MRRSADRSGDLFTGDAVELELVDQWPQLISGCCGELLAFSLGDVTPTRWARSFQGCQFNGAAHPAVQTHLGGSGQQPAAAAWPGSPASRRPGELQTAGDAVPLAVLVRGELVGA